MTDQMTVRGRRDLAEKTWPKRLGRKDLAEKTWPKRLGRKDLAVEIQRITKRAPVETGARLLRTRKPAAYLSLRCFSAVPRISPSVAPESEEPYCAMASFSSATSSALIETCTLRAFLSNWITRASTFSPTAKRSAR